MTPSRTFRNIALIGFMGSGKSCIGRLVAARLHFEFLDTDHLIEVHAGLSIADLFARQGEACFREVERQVVEQLAQRERCVIATGGGVGADPQLLACLKRHALVVCLWASAETIWQRVHKQTHRPLLQVPNPQTRIRELLAQRQPVYRQADVLLNANSRRLTQTAAQVVKQYLCVAPNPTPA